MGDGNYCDRNGAVSLEDCGEEKNVGCWLESEDKRVSYACGDFGPGKGESVGRAS